MIDEESESHLCRPVTVASKTIMIISVLLRTSWIERLFSLYLSAHRCDRCIPKGLNGIIYNLIRQKETDPNVPNDGA
jgi:hypothetical protein